MKLTIENASSKLSEVRQSKGLTLDKLSQETGVAKSTLIAIEADRVKPHATTIFKINSYLEKYDEMV